MIYRYGLELVEVQRGIQEIAPDYVVLPSGPYAGLIVGNIVFPATLVLPGIFAWQIRRKSQP